MSNRGMIQKMVDDIAVVEGQIKFKESKGEVRKIISYTVNK